MSRLGSSPTMRPGLNRGPAIAAVLVLLAIVAAATSLITTRRAGALEDSRQSTANLAQLLAEQTSRSMQMVDLTLRQIGSQLVSRVPGEATTLPQIMGSNAAHDILADQLQDLPQADALLIVGPDGGLLSSTRGFPAARQDLSDRDYFQHFRAVDDHAAFVSGPMRSYSSGEWIMVVARRINDGRGDFAGVVAAAITLSFLEDFYQAAMPADNAVTVLRRDGTVLVHFPHNESRIGMRLPPDAPWYRLLDAGGGSYRSPGYLDRRVTVVSMLPLRDFPMVIDVSRTDAAALAGWRRETLWLLGAAGLAGTAVLALLWVFDAQLCRLKLSEASLARQNMELRKSRLQFDAALENISQGVTFFDGDQKLIVCNSRYRDICRLPPELTRPGTPLSDIVVARGRIGSFPDITPGAYLARREALARSGKPFEVIDELRDGRIVLLRYQPMPNGGWVATHEDITERRRAEATTRVHGAPRCADRAAQPDRCSRSGWTRRWLRHGARRGCAVLLPRPRRLQAGQRHARPSGRRRAAASRRAARLLSASATSTPSPASAATNSPSSRSASKRPNRRGRAGRARDRRRSPSRSTSTASGSSIGASIGVAVAPADGTSCDDAAEAMPISRCTAPRPKAAAPSASSSRRWTRALQGRRGLELDLRDALASDAFELHYQPLIDLRTAAGSAASRR